MTWGLFLTWVPHLGQVLCLQVCMATLALAVVIILQLLDMSLISLFILQWLLFIYCVSWVLCLSSKLRKAGTFLLFFQHHCGELPWSEVSSWQQWPINLPWNEFKDIWVQELVKLKLSGQCPEAIHRPSGPLAMFSSHHHVLCQHWQGSHFYRSSFF